MEAGFERHHMSENLKPRQYALAKLLGDYYGYRLQNEVMPNLESDLINLFNDYAISDEMHNS